MNSPDPTSSTDPDAEQSQTDNAQTTGDCSRITNEAVNQLVTDGNRRHTINDERMQKMVLVTSYQQVRAFKWGEGHGQLLGSRKP
jgi:hypothetical protein